MLPPDFIEELRSRTTLSTVIGRRVKLTKHGREHQACCPFHNEKTPSFTVNDDKGFFHCFGCGAHGDAIGFEMRANHLSFLDAVERLAADCGLEMPETTPEERARGVRRASLHQAMEAACAFFEAQLVAPAGRAGLDYLRGRGLTDETIARFRLGWAPEGNVLKRTLTGDRYPEDLLIEAGLLRRNDERNSTSDMFRGRITFPITDRRGRVVAFGARALGDGQPKYLNSPATPIFDKGATLYGMALAVEGAGKAGRSVAVEGYMDVIAMHQAGLDFAVAPLGTALTERQLAELWKLTDEPVICLDGDEAGRRAMARVIERGLSCLQPGKSLGFAELPSRPDPDGGKPGKYDPDSLIREQGAEAMLAQLDRAVPLADAVWNLAVVTHSPTTPEREAALERLLYARACSIPDAVARKAYLRRFRRRLTEDYWPPAPAVLIGRSKKNFAPRPGGSWIEGRWAFTRAAEELASVREWLGKHGVDWDGLEAALGGVGFARARLVKGKWAEREEWGPIPPPSLWEPEEGGQSLVILPDWDVGPDGEAHVVDLVGWDARSGKLYQCTGQGIVLGQHLVDEALGFEGLGLSHPVHVAADALSWLRRVSAGERSVLVVDWGRAWEALGHLGSLQADTLELGEQLEKHVLPPALPAPKIGIVEGVV